MQQADVPPVPLPPCILRRAVLGWLALLGSPSVRALDSPGGPVILTVSGRVRLPNLGTAAEFDMAMLAALPQATLSTRTPWFTAKRRFTGPLLRDVLAAARAEGTTLRMRALNDYRVDVPADDAQRFDVVVARLLDDRPMAVRDKGPLFVIYPFDDQPELRNAVYYSRSAWQLRSIEVL